MYTFLVRRILLMIPTFFGISLAVWLVMALSPGRPGEQHKGGPGGEDTDTGKDPLKAAQENEAVRIFRRQFGLDRPVLWNNWTDLDEETLRKDIATESGDINVVGATAKREARERLEDYGPYAVPALIGLLEKTTGPEQTGVRYWLGRCALRLPVRQYGREIDRETLAKHREWTVENVELSRYTWPPGASPEERAPIVRKWVDWFAKNKERWEWSAAEKLKIAVADTQFGTYWGQLLKGDLGTSHLLKRPVLELVLERMKYSLSLNLVALVISYVLAVPLGIFSAVKAGSVADRSIAVVLFMLYSLPSFFVGTLLVQWLALGTPYKVFPQSGWEGIDAPQLNTWQHFKDVLWHITLPLVCLSYGGLAFLSRLSRTGMLDVIRSDYIRTARAKGLSEWTVVVKHVVRNGILPIVTLLGSALPVLIGGSVFVEFIFGINGMGLLMYSSIMGKDFNVVMGVQLIIGFLTMVGILLSDIAYALLDPRISLS